MNFLTFFDFFDFFNWKYLGFVWMISAPSSFLLLLLLAPTDPHYFFLSLFPTEVNVCISSFPLFWIHSLFTCIIFHHIIKPGVSSFLPFCLCFLAFFFFFVSFFPFLIWNRNSFEFDTPLSILPLPLPVHFRPISGQRVSEMHVLWLFSPSRPPSNHM